MYQEDIESAYFIEKHHVPTLIEPGAGHRDLYISRLARGVQQLCLLINAPERGAIVSKFQIDNPRIISY